MDHLTTCIEQLDLAAQQLHQDNAAYRRFALILTDNIVELMCHDRCEDEFRFEDPNRGYSKYPAGKKAEVMGGDFKDRLNFLQSIGVLSADQRTFAAYAHDYRNESYHTGIVHDDIMHSLAWHYHSVACELFVALQRRYVYSRGSATSPAWQKHGGTEQLYWGREEAYRAVANSLGMVRPLPVPNLPDALATSIRTRIQSVQEAIDYLVSDSPKAMNEAEVIRDIQYWAEYGKRYDGRAIDSNDTVALEEAKKFIAWLDNDWKPDYPKTPLPSWTARAERLRRATTVANALQNFAALRRDIEPFGEMTFSSASALSSYVDLEIDRMKEDRAMGKR